MLKQLFKIFGASDFPSKMQNVLTEKLVFRLTELKNLIFLSLIFLQLFFSSSFSLKASEFFSQTMAPCLPTSFIAFFHACLYITSTSLHFFHRMEYKNHPLIFFSLFLALRFWLMLNSDDSLKSRGRQVVLATIAAAKWKSQCRCRRQHNTVGMWPSSAAMVLGQCLRRGIFFQFYQSSICKTQVSFLENWGMSTSINFLFFFTC